MKLIKKVYLRLCKYFNSGEKYENSSEVNELFADYIEWHHKKCGHPILKRSKTLSMINDFFKEKNKVIYQAEILHDINSRTPRKDLFFGLFMLCFAIFCFILYLLIF
jgi:hypothetical protein